MAVLQARCSIFSGHWALSPFLAQKSSPGRGSCAVRYLACVNLCSHHAVSFRFARDNGLHWDTRAPRSMVEKEQEGRDIALDRARVPLAPALRHGGIASRSVGLGPDAPWSLSATAVGGYGSTCCDVGFDRAGAVRPHAGEDRSRQAERGVLDRPTDLTGPLVVRHCVACQ